MRKAPQVSIILPVYKQASHIEQVVKAYIDALNHVRIKYDVILAVNGNTDNSLAVCRDIEAGCHFVNTVYSHRAGWGKAVRLGIRAGGGSLLCFTNSARTSPEDLVRVVLYAILNPGHVIKAKRKNRDSLVRRVGSLLYNLQCRCLFGIWNWDLNGTPKVFPRSLEKLLEMRRSDDLLDLEFNMICRAEGYPILEVPVFTNRRFAGQSTTTFWSAIRMYVGAYKMWREGRR